MSPKTYSENTSENSYTGRPSGEMSLYQGSMSSSETNRYRLRMWVDEEYNPQGDGGSLSFSVKVNVYGKDGDKMSVKDQILAANPLQEEKEKMFNYTSNGYYVVSETSYGLQTEKDPNYVTKGLYSMEDEDGISYYFRGDIDNNNVQFGEYESDYYVYSPDNYSYFQSLESCQQYSSSCSESNRVKLASKGDKMYWKIVRINGDGSLRLIYNGTSTTPDNSNLSNSFKVGKSPYNLKEDDQKYVGYTYDNGTDSFVKREVDIWYQNTLGSSSYDSSVIEGRFCSDSSGYKKASEYGFINEYRSKDMYYSSTGKRLGGRLKTTKTDNNPTLICPETSETYGGSYRLKAGLITADELVLAGENYLLVGESYYLQGYMNDFWTMTPAMFITSHAIAGVWVHNEYDDTGYAASGLSSLRPVINVKADNFTSGFGTSSNPYVIEV